MGLECRKQKHRPLELIQLKPPRPRHHNGDKIIGAIFCTSVVTICTSSNLVRAKLVFPLPNITMASYFLTISRNKSCGPATNVHVPVAIPPHSADNDGGSLFKYAHFSTVKSRDRVERLAYFQPNSYPMQATNSINECLKRVEEAEVASRVERHLALSLLGAAAISLQKRHQVAIFLAMQQQACIVSPIDKRYLACHPLSIPPDSSETLQDSSATPQNTEVGLCPGKEMGRNSSLDHTSEGRMYIDFILADDILCGRGGHTNHHTGNKRFRLVVLKIKFIYQQCPAKTLKTDLSRAIVEHCCLHGARFVKIDEVVGRYYVLTTSEARKKTSQALREMKTSQALREMKAIKWTV